MESSISNQAEVEKAFQEFDWRDSRWQEYLSGLFPIPNHQMIDKWKRKWYKRTIDSRINLTDESSAAAAATSTSSGASTATSQTTPSSSQPAATAVPPLEFWKIIFKAISFYGQLIALLCLFVSFFPFLNASKNLIRYTYMLILVSMFCKISSNHGFPTRWRIMTYLSAVSQTKEYITCLLLLLLPFTHRFTLGLIPLMITIVINTAITIVTRPKYLPDVIALNPFVLRYARIINAEIISLFQMRSTLVLYYGLFLFLNCIRTLSFISFFLYITFTKLAMINQVYSFYTHQSVNKLDSLIKYYVLSRSWCPGFLKSIYSTVKPFLTF